MSELRKLAKHSSHYLGAQIAGMAAGLISMPILARLLTREDYGRLSLVLLSVGFLATFARFGVPQSITRHFVEYAKEGGATLSAYTSSLCSFVLGIFTVTLPVFVLLGLLARGTAWQDWAPAIALVGFLLCNEVGISVVAEFYRAQQRSLLTAALDVANRYGALIGSLLFFLLVARTLGSFLAGKAVAQGFVVAAFASPLVVGGLWRPGKINWGIVRQAVRYGLPLSIATAGGFFIAYGDRYVIQSLLDSTQVARYSLPYDILQQLEAALTTPVRMAVVPMVFATLVDKGTSAASELVSRVVQGMLLLVIPIVVGISVVGEDVVVLLGSQKYADSAVLMPFLSAGILSGAVNFLFTIGLSYQKRTGVIAAMTLASGVLNILLNLVLVPWLGVLGSALATLGTYLLHVAVSYHLSSRHLRIVFYPRSLLHAGCGAGVMALGLWLMGIYLPSGPLSLAWRVPVGALLYGLVLICLDRDVRRVAGRGRLSLGQMA